MERPTPLRFLLVCAVAGAGLLVFGETLRWLWRVPFTGEDRRLNLVLLVGFVALMLHRGLRAWHRPAESSLHDGREAALAVVPAAPLGLFIAATCAHAVVEHTLQANTLTAVLFALASYGLMGCFASRAQFAAGLSSVLLGIAVLPLAALAEGYVGLFARLITAELVQQLLSSLHIGVVPAHTILVLERGIAHVDIPCSGLRGLWSGLVGYLLLTWLERRRVGLRFWLGLFAMQGILFGANLLRVFVLVYVAQVAGLSRLAEALHVPLGLVGFVVGLAFALGYLRYVVPALQIDLRGSASADAGTAHPRSWGLPGLARRRLLAFIAAFLATVALGDRLLPRPHAASASPPPRLPDRLAAASVPLSAGEQEIFGRFGARAGKWRLPGGSLIVVSAPNLTAFRAHHPPEVCLLAAGLRVLHTEPLEIVPGSVARHLTLTERMPTTTELTSAASQRQGLYWFQSASSTTPDILTRIYRQILRREPWLMVTLLSDAQSTADRAVATADLLRMAREIHATLDASLHSPGGALPPASSSAVGEPAAPSMQ